ncbi:flagellar export protein FliJ [Atopomonas sediminilitoris]|uniref:flagellar export protein FliJ n=1 Tax=Atopomonas sediminilitoris TaxID=2919919 RepID=UPI001F4D62AB|nr:flagellar export protein FliJ [Atopomonas sediminilitoris]MCJ8167948.1 flagella biosynthesis chaperone FliJ [Atopomonas sediminilitoris]
MADARIQRLQPAIALAEKAEREAARVLGQCQQQLQGAVSKLEELERYRGEYQQQWLSMGRQGVTADWIQRYQRFLAQLDTAIGQQQQAVQMRRHQQERAALQWRARQGRLEALRKVIERYRAEAIHRGARAEQKQLDELVARSHWRRQP